MCAYLKFSDPLPKTHLFFIWPYKGTERYTIKDIHVYPVSAGQVSIKQVFSGRSLLVLMLYLPVNNFTFMLGRFPFSLCWTSTTVNLLYNNSECLSPNNAFYRQSRWVRANEVRLYFFIKLHFLNKICLTLVMAQSCWIFIFYDFPPQFLSCSSEASWSGSTVFKKKG